MKKIAIIGIGGRTATMFAQELKNSAEILGVGKKEEVEKLKAGKIFLQRNGQFIKYEGKVISEQEFDGNFNPHFIFLCVKNPISQAVNYYYSRLDKENLPSLILSQNGISVIEEAKKELKKIFGKEAKDIPIIRISLFTPVSKEKFDNKIKISYFLPIGLSFGLASGKGETKEIEESFQKANILAEKIPPQNIKNMEFSKLLTNLIGMASIAEGLSIEKGFEDRETFQEEILAIREYLKVIKKKGGKILNFKNYPLKTFSFLINYFPLMFLKMFRKKMVKKITQKREEKEKGNIDEIDYYNGAVINLGEELKIKTPINQKIYGKIKEKL